MAGNQQLDSNYKPIPGSVGGYDPVSAGFVAPLVGLTKIGSDNTTYAPLATSPTDGLRATYSASITGLASAASATDIFTITGSATKIVRVTRIEISGQATTAAAAQVVLLVRSGANLTGTSTSPTAVPHDSASAAATATVKAYTVNPGTLGTLVGNIRVAYTFLAAPATATVGSEPLFLDFGTRPSQAIVLRGTTQVFAVNLNAATVTGGAWDINLEWTEEALT